jgi:hypothetical protein
VTDITEIPTIEGKLFLCGILDLRCKRVLGWSMRHRQDAHGGAGGADGGVAAGRRQLK